MPLAAVKKRTPPPVKENEKARQIELNQKYVSKMIEIKKIETDNQQVRKETDDDHIIELAASISVHGLLEPIVVAKNENGSYQLIAGYHRLRAVNRLGWNEIPATILEHNNDTPIKALALVENIIRRDMSIEEECTAVKHLYDEEKKSPSQICQLIGKSRAWVDRRLAANSLPENIREFMFDGQLSIAAAELIATVENEGMRNSILNEAVYAKRTLHQIRDLIQLTKETPSMGEAIEAGVETITQRQTAAQVKKNCEACGTIREYHQLRPVFVCALGCDEAKLSEAEHAISE